MNYSEIINANKHLSKWEIARRIAFNFSDLFGEDLFPHHCIDILKEVYGKRLEIMNPDTIISFCSIMMSTHVDPDIEEIKKVVNEYLNDF